MDAVSPVMLQQFDGLPDGIMEAAAGELLELLGGPSLIHIQGEKEAPVFLSILLHGNETSGLGIVQKLLRRYSGQQLPRSILLLVGNVAAAAAGRRQLQGQPDYNRIWPDQHGRFATHDTAHSGLASQVMQVLSGHSLYAAVDIHNNSGRNPAHACITSLDQPHVDLAAMFAPLLLHYSYPGGTLAQALIPHCPVTTIECGLPGDAQIQDQAVDFISKLLACADIPPAQSDVRILRNVATVRVPSLVRIAPLADGGELEIPSDLDRWNWREMPAGALLARQNAGLACPVTVLNGDGQDCTARYLREEGGDIIAARPLIPAMISLDTRIIRQDCLCYLLEPACKSLSAGT